MAVGDAMLARFKAQVLSLLPAALAMALVEAIATAHRSIYSSGDACTLGICAFFYAVPFFEVLCIAVAFVATIISWLVGPWARRPVVRLGESVRYADVIGSLPFVGIAGGVCLYAAGAFLRRNIKNDELAVFGVVVSSFLVFLLVVPVFLCTVVAWGALRARVSRRVSLAAVSLPYVVLLTAGAMLVVAARHTLVQIDAWLIAAPLAFALALGVTLRIRARLRVSGGVLAASVAGTYAIALAIGFALPETPSALVSWGAWSRYVVMEARSLTDFDGDGYSSLFGGGDCAPFDKRVNPGAQEIPEDGIDNNCVGGDAKRIVIDPPAWAEIPSSIPTNMNLVIVTIEAMRADHVSFLGFDRDTTPNLKRFAESAVVFRNMYSAAPMTRLCLAALFSSYSPSEVQWLRNGTRWMRAISPSTPWLPAILHDAGFTTLAVLNGFRAFSTEESAGFERGFSQFDTSTPVDYTGGTLRGFPSQAQVDKAIEMLGKLGNHERFFMWLHLMEPHYLYEQPPDAPVYGTSDLSRYDAEIWHVDHQVNRLLDALQARGVLDQTIVFVTGDHGEAFGEHGDYWHGPNLYNAALRAGALLRVPGLGRRDDEAAVTFTDMAPTLLNLLRVDAGRSNLADLVRHDVARAAEVLLRRVREEVRTRATCRGTRTPRPARRSSTARSLLEERAPVGVEALSMRRSMA
jgi:hypothetical protein